MQEQEPAFAVSVVGAPQRPVTVLLVDDQAIIGEAIRRMLVSEADIRFHYCSDPTAALALAIDIAPTVILQDLVMPDMDGLELVRVFREHPATRDVPLIVLSTREDPQVKAEAFALGANDYLVKLPDRLELIARLRYHSKGYINLLERNDAYQALERLTHQLELRNQFLRETFGRYLTDDIVASLLDSPAGLQLGGEKRQVTILMADLRGFTSLSNRLTPEQVVVILNRYLGAMVEVITWYQGTIDEFIGDAILVIFGAPLGREDDPQRAVACAIAMQLAMTAVNEQNAREGLPAVAMGIGVHTGEVVVGNIGSPKRTKYGVVGTPVNLTSRIESYTIGGQVLISETTRQALGPLVKVTEQMKIEAKGIDEPITVYDVQGIDAPYKLCLPQHADTLAALQQPIPLRYTLLEGAHPDSPAFAGHFVKLSLHRGVLWAEHLPTPWSDIKIQLVAPSGETFPGNLYAKVLQPVPENQQECLVYFTSVPPELMAMLRPLAQPAP